jgi:hypothetical protein
MSEIRLHGRLSDDLVVKTRPEGGNHFASVGGIASMGCGWRSFQESYMDALGPFAQVVIALLSSIAKMEREKLRERTLAGLARARKAGRIGGRPKATENYELVQEVVARRLKGESIRQIAAIVGASPATVQKLLSSEANAAEKHSVRLEVVKHTEAKRGFVLLPRRWVVERSFAWAARFRRLARDYERLSETLTGLHYLAFAILMLANLARLLTLSS